MSNSYDSVRDKIRARANKNSDLAQAMLRTFMMERFMERVSVSQYRDRFILKGGLLVSSLVGVDLRSTMDIDATVRALPVNHEETRRIIEEIAGIDIGDNVSFDVGKSVTIMHEHDYQGIRFLMRATMGGAWQPLAIDISTDDVITPGAIEYEMPLLLEDRTINVLAYNNETLLAEKIHSVISHGEENTRMRDFYDLYTFVMSPLVSFDYNLLAQALHATVSHRGDEKDLNKIREIASRIADFPQMPERWERFCTENEYASQLSWRDVAETLLNIVSEVSERFSENTT
ncbi:MAG: nucleotidyl transferase AbiEii/AbiGii toxin family protein [Actinomycetaceae bacterium]|nr:nucleotidyl transferase AbiEii/AbiGii toxin family protein [Actinomycetaceae bacterium]